jgi:hypothetical protein
MTLRKVSENRSLLTSEEAVFKLMYLALKNISKRWTMPIRNWSGAMNQFAIIFEGRVPMGDSIKTTYTNCLEPPGHDLLGIGRPNPRIKN